VLLAVKKYGSDIRAQWSDEFVHAVYGVYDRDGDDKLDLGEFSSLLRDLKERGGSTMELAALEAKAAEREAASTRRAELEAVWRRHVKEGNVWDKGSSGKLIRELNAENYWEDFGAKVTSWHAALTGDEGKKATATFEQFEALYPSLLAEVAAIQQQWRDEDAARAAAQALARAEEFKAGRSEWDVTMKRVPDAINAAWQQGKTALLVDCTTLPGDNKASTFSPLETFYSYSGEVLLELKKAVVEVSIKKEKTVEEVQDEIARKLLMGLKQGRSLIVLCSNAVPPLKSKLTHADRFPPQLFDAAQLKACLGEGAVLEETFLGGLMRWKNDAGLRQDPSYNAVIGHADFRAVLVTKFDPADYRGFLEEELPVPFDRLQPIKVFVEPS